MMAMDDPNPQTETAPQAAARIRVAEIWALLMDPQASVDAAPLISELERLATRVRERPDSGPELRQILICLGTLEYRRGDRSKARGLLIDGLAIDPGASADPNQLVRDHYFLAGVASDLRSFQTAAEHYAKAAQWSATATDFDIDRRLGIRERHAFALHEAGRFIEAYEVNRSLLEEGEARFGAGDSRLCTVIVNTAQNLYALHRLAEAESYLQRALGLAKEAGEIEREQDLLYQLAVLAAEQGQATAARGYLVERVTRLERGSAAGGLREAARRCLEDFDLQRSRSKALT
jgi:tetratricopeptide (TPR) repeat protein